MLLDLPGKYEPLIISHPCYIFFIYAYFFLYRYKPQQNHANHSRMIHYCQIELFKSFVEIAFYMLHYVL